MVYGDTTRVPPTEAAERATQRLGTKELTGKETHPGLLGVSEARRQRKGEGEGREGKINPSCAGGSTLGWGVGGTKNSSEDHPPT